MRPRAARDSASASCGCSIPCWSARPMRGGRICSKSGGAVREGTSFHRVHAGGAPTRTEELDAYLVVTDNGSRLRLANNLAGLDLWQTAEEAERARADEERAHADEERVRADEERARADEERARADQEQARADQERARAESAAAEVTRLRRLLDEHK